MNARSILLVVVASSTVGLLVAACGAPPPSGEPTGSTEEAMQPINPGPPPVWAPNNITCGPSEGLGENTFEGGLSAFGCGPKRYYSPSTNTTGYFATICPQATAFVSCPGKSPAYLSLYEFYECWRGVSPYYPGWNTNMETCAYSYVPAGHAEIGFDPTCQGGDCNIRIE